MLLFCYFRLCLTKFHKHRDHVSFLESAIVSSFKNLFVAAVIVLSGTTSILQAQDPVDSLELYDPFSQINDLRRIIKTDFTILGKKSQERIAALNKEAASLNIKKPGDAGQALMKIGDIYFRSGIYNLALESYFKALDRFELAGDMPRVAISHMKLGRTYYFADLPSPVNHLMIAKEFFEKIGDPKYQAYFFYLKANTTDNENERARFIKKALNAQRTIVNDGGTDETNLALFATLLNADGKYEEGIRVAENLPDKWLLVLILNNYGHKLATVNNLDKALPVFRRSLAICKKERYKTLLRNTYENIAMVYRLKDDWKNAALYMQFFKVVSESLYLEQHSYQVSEMEVKYETRRKAIENDFLKKEKEVLAQSAATQRGLNILLFVSIVGVSLFTLVLVLGNRKLKKVNTLLDSQNNEIRKNQEELQILNEVLSKSEKNLNEAQSIAHLANWEMEPGPGTFQFSAQFPVIMGMPPERLAKEGFQAIINEICHPDHIEMLASFMGFRGPVSPEKVLEFRLLLDGETRWIRIKKKEIVDSKGLILRFSGTVQDITDAKEEESIRIKIAEQRAFTKKLISYQEEERKRVAGELHDGLGQDLLLIKNLALLGLQNPDADPVTSGHMDQISRTVSQLLDSIRRLSFELRPAHLERLGLSEVLISAIERLKAISSIHFTRKIESVEGLLSNTNAIHLFRIVQESLNNAVKHSGASEISVELKRDGEMIVLTINDNGKGFDPAEVLASSSGFGLRNIISRLEIAKGQSEITSKPGEGATIKVLIPVEENG